MPQPQKKDAAYDAFTSVDKLVSKPVLGSDGAASWQEFRKDNKKSIYNKTSSAPLAPLKKADKLGSGLTSWSDERNREEEARKETGSAALGEGYTNFKAKDGQEEALQRKEKKRIEKRIRPDNIEYYLASKTFTGWKWDYVFTTKDHGTGYYWDGGDSLKRLNGELPATAGPHSTTTTTTTAGEGEEEEDAGGTNNSNNKRPASGDGAVTTATSKEKKKKKRKKAAAAPQMVNDPNNPIEQVQAAIRARNERLGLTNHNNIMATTTTAPTTKTMNHDDNLLPAGWEAATDPSTQKVYYFHRETGTRQWEKPKPPAAVEENLPEGWKIAQAEGGKQYYYHTSGEVRWEKPT